MKFKSDIEVQAGLKDSSGSNGSSGQILSSNGSTVSWVNAGSSVANDVQNQVKAGVAINKGQAVYVTGADGTNIIVGLASNTTEATSSKTLGLLNATVAVNGFADVVQIGKLAGLNTSAATVGDPVWLGTNGNLIYGLANKPYAPAHLVFIGVVTRVNANNGEIFITVQNGFELKEIHDVDVITNVPINGDVLGYNGTLWVNKTIAEWLGYVPADDALVVHKAGTETITGTKTFLDNITYFSNNGSYNIELSNPDDLTSVLRIGASAGSGNISSDGGIGITVGGSISAIGIAASGSTFFSNTITAPGFKTYSGTASQFLKANGTVDSTVYVPTTRTLTINGSTQDLSANRTFTIDTGVTSFNTRTGAVTLTSGDVTTALGYTPVTNARTLTINGVSYDLSADRSWTVSGGIGGSGTTNYIPKFTASTTVGNSSLYDNGNIGFGTTSPNGLWSGSNKTLQITGGTNIASELVQSRPSATISRFLSGTSSTFGVYTADALNYEIYTSGSQRFAVNSSGNVIANVDSRAPIFYDSNDTTYYGDFASTSNFSKLLLNSQNSFNTTTPGLTSYGLTLMGGTADYANGVIWTWGNTNAQAGIYVQSSGAYGTKMYFATTDSFATGSKTGMSMDHNGTVLVNRSYLQSDSSLRAPIFYDSNNTGYYVDPASTSNMNYVAGNRIYAGADAGVDGSISTNNWFRSVGATGWYNQTYSGGWHMTDSTYVRSYNDVIVITNSSFRSPIFYDINDTTYYTDPASTSNLFGLQLTGASNKYLYINPGNGYEAMVRFNGGSGNTWYAGKRTSAGINGTADFHFYSDAAGADMFGITATGTAQASGDMRAPIFYDSNDTGYYVDPASTSNLAGLTVANTITGSVSGSSGYSRYLPNNYVGGQQTNPQVYFNYAQGLNVAMTGAWSVWSDTLWINGYSGGDVPNMCALHFLRNGQPRMAISTQNREATSYGSFYEVITEWSNDQVKSGYFQSNSSLRAPVFYDSNNTGYYLDPSSTSNLYAANFGGPSHFTSNLGGYCGSLSNPPLQAYSDSNNSAFFSFHKGGNYALNMGLDADNVLRIGGWSASASRWELDMSGNNWVAGSFRAPIFYDSSDTGYYVDPASTSNLKFLQVGRPSNGQSGTKLLGGQGTSYGAITLDVEISNYGTGIKINNQGSTYANSAMAFFYNSSQCGGVSIGSNVTYYNTSSDYRLKENITSIDSAVNRLNKLKPCRFNFISNPEKTVDGFIAHEVQEVIPEAVTGFKDEFEEDGTPKYQGIDQSKIVPLLTAALQEAIEKINSLEQRINILENK